MVGAGEVSVMRLFSSLRRVFSLGQSHSQQCFDDQFTPPSMTSRPSRHQRLVGQLIHRRSVEKQIWSRPSGRPNVPLDSLLASIVE